jgi:hypothetical protein
VDAAHNIHRTKQPAHSKHNEDDRNFRPATYEFANPNVSDCFDNHAREGWLKLKELALIPCIHI